MSAPDATKALMAFALFTTAVIFNVAAIANNNLQDLKTGQLVDATPWKQQVALIIGVIAGAVVIPPVLNLVNQAYGFVGAPGAEVASAPTARAAGRPDLIARARRHRRGHRLESDPDGRIDRRRHHRARRDPRAHDDDTCAFHRSRWDSGFICRRRARS